METNRMRYEMFIRRSHGYVGRFVGGADADSYTRFAGLYADMNGNENPSEELKKDFYTKLGGVKAVLDAAITLYQDRKRSEIPDEEDQELTNLCNELFESEGGDIISIVDRANGIYDRIDDATH